MKYISYLVLVLALLCAGCSSRIERQPAPVDTSKLGILGDSIDHYIDKAKAPYEPTLLTSLDICLYGLDEGTGRKLSSQSRKDLRTFLFQRVVDLLEQEFQEGFCNNNHKYFEQLAAAVDSLQTKFQGIPDKEQQTLAKLADWYRRHRNASTPISYPSQTPTSPKSKYAYAQAQRVLQDVRNNYNAYPHASKCKECKRADEVQQVLNDRYKTFVRKLIDLYGQELFRDTDIEKNISTHIEKLSKESDIRDFNAILREVGANKSLPQDTIVSTYVE